MKTAVRTEARPGTAAALHRVSLVVAALLAVVGWGAVVSALVYTNHTMWAVLFMLAIGVRLVVVLGERHPVLAIAAVLGLFAYSFFAGAATNIATGLEQDPFGPHCEGDWVGLSLGQHCGTR